mgnify:CR=1 FL=1
MSQPEAEYRLFLFAVHPLLVLEAHGKAVYLFVGKACVQPQPPAVEFEEILFPHPIVRVRQGQLMFFFKRPDQVCPGSDGARPLKPFFPVSAKMLHLSAQRYLEFGFFLPVSDRPVVRFAPYGVAKLFFAIKHGVSVRDAKPPKAAECVQN